MSRPPCNRRIASRPKSNKNRPGSDSGEHYGQAGYTCQDDTEVKGHYMTKKKQEEQKKQPTWYTAFREAALQ